MNAHIRNVADRFARQGHAVIAPDLFKSTPSISPLFEEDIVSSAMQFMKSLKPTRDPDCLVTELKKPPEEKREKVSKFVNVVMSGSLPYDKILLNLVGAYEYMKESDFVLNSLVGSVGFCLGGNVYFFSLQRKHISMHSFLRSKP